MNLIKIENKEGKLLVSSRVVAEELGKEHSDVTRKIREILTVGEFSEREFITARGNKYQELLLTKKSFILLVMNYEGYNDFKRAYIDRFEEMEKELQQKAPKTLKEALILALQQQEEIEQLQGTVIAQTQVIEEFKPKKEYLDTILSSEDTLCISQIAADYGMSGKKLNGILNKQKLIRKVNKQWLLYAEHFEKGYTKSETFKIKKDSGIDKIVLHTKWTQKGRLEIHQILTSLNIKANMDKNR